MPAWLQHFLALTLVTLCGAVLTWQAIRSLRGAGKLGRCCAKGCDSTAAPSRPAADCVVFFPSDSLRRRR